MSDLRIGLGLDAHALEDGVPLVLGGVPIEHPRGLAGHSDGDVIAHALVDALLGAAGLGDIGSLFPSGDERWQGADSLDLLRDAYEQVREAGYALVSADCVLVGEEPRIAPHRDEMRLRLADALAVDPGSGQRACDDDRPARLHGPRRGPRRPGGGTVGARMKLVRYADRPDLLEIRFEQLSRPTFPEYMHNNEPGNKYWGRLYSDFPAFQVGLLDGDRLVAEAHARARRLGRHAGGSPVRLGRGIRARDDVRSGADGALGARHQRVAGGAGAAAVVAHDPGVQGHRARGRAERGDRAGAADVEGALPTHPDRAVHGVAA